MAGPTNAQEFLEGLRKTVVEAVAHTVGQVMSARQQAQQQQAQHLHGMHQNPQARPPTYTAHKVVRHDAEGNTFEEVKTVPQLLAELCDHMMDVKDILRKRRR